MTIPRLYVPMLEAEDVIRHLGKEEKHWKLGYSAHALAQAWFHANDFPPAVKSFLSQHPLFSSATLVDAFLEREVDLKTAGRPSQTDLLAIIGLEKRTAILAVEGKVDESFGEVVCEWLGKSDTKRTRLEGLCQTLGLTIEQALPLRYQLLHRTCSAIYEAQRYKADTALMVVHSFAPEQTGFLDFSKFLSAVGLGESFKPGGIFGPIQSETVSLYAGWVPDDAAASETPQQFYSRLKEYAAQESERFARLSRWCDLNLINPSAKG